MTSNELVIWLEGYLSAAIGQNGLTPQQVKGICDKLTQVRDQVSAARLTYLPKPKASITFDDDRSTIISIDYNQFK